MRKMRKRALIRLECVGQRWRWVRPAPQEPQYRQSQDGDTHGLVPREHGQFLHSQRQVVGDAGERDLYDQQHNDEPMQKLRDVAPTGGGISDGHVSKLKRVSISCKIPLSVAVVTLVCLAACLGGCPTRPNAPAAAPAPQSRAEVPVHEGRPYDIASTDSLLTILVFRGGALAKAGHNHVIASHALSGTLYVPADLARSTFEVHVPVAELTVDETPLRAKENEADFPPDVPDSAKDGTRRNMLGGALLDGEHYPEIVLRSERLEPAPTGSDAQWLAHVQVTVRDRVNSVLVPVHYTQSGDDVVVSGEFPLKQTDLGLTPFSALLGALQVVDEMTVRFRVVAHAAMTQSGR